MKKEYKSPKVEVEMLEPGAICSSCAATLTNNSDLMHCGYEVDMPVIGSVALFPQDLGGCTCWQQGMITDMYCYMPSESQLFSS